MPEYREDIMSETRAGDHGATDRGYRFAPYEVAFCGSSGSGKTTLATKLIEELADTYRIGFAKHDAHSFTMDREGKDTWRASRSGAVAVSIGNAEGSAALFHGFTPEGRSPFGYDVDFALVEGYSRSDLAKIMVVDSRGELLDEAENGTVSNIVGWALRKGVPPGVARRVELLAGRQPADGLPAAEVLDADDVQGAKELVLGHFKRRAASLSLHGLVLGGGKSSRMGGDKASIAYHGAPQSRWVAGLLELVCDRVYVSTRSEQAGEPAFAGLRQIHDRFVDFGPIGGILTALHEDPAAAWLVFACDLPFVTAEIVEELVRRRDPLKLATCFDSDEDGLPEPLCAIYEPAIRGRLLEFLAGGRSCPRKALIESRCARLAPPEAGSLANVNDPSARDLALERLGGRADAAGITRSTDGSRSGPRGS